MRKLPPWSMELLLMTALAITVIITVLAIREAPGDRTRFTLERSDAPRMIGGQREPVIAEETSLGR